ncbi:uncharacterized protein KY384_008670 [Bacidia gigantensis]|uniref:uncharacterized protein n=1 Tax=Bacidia gigantensis TaxID=2732470 RepID=UPI001D03FB04|nr:uncharacterized protein KY384_008670 [Bacidia gigantensis]KAG8526470.1 hypothetical protein KY384_008670 [Bacidia gigantensis]
MASPISPSSGPSPQQIAQLQQQVAVEAQKRGITPQEFQAQQRKQLEADARKAGLPLDQYINKIKQQAWEQHQKQQQMTTQRQQNGQLAHTEPSGQTGQGQQVPIQPGAPEPKALAVAKWLRGQDLKTRTCILNGQRKDMFKVKRALRALLSPGYTAAQKKNTVLPRPPSNQQEAAELFKLLPLSLLALRVSKIDPHAGHDHGNTPKRVKGLWTVKIEQQQDISETLHYVWLYDGPQWRMKLYAAGALLAIMTIVMFPLWPIQLRLGVWYLSMGFLGLVGLFFVMAIFRLILFCVTVVTMPKGLWLYPNLFEDVGFFDSFRPIWAWQEEKGKKGSKKSKKPEPDSQKEKAKGKKTKSTEHNADDATRPALSTEESTKGRHSAPTVEEVID